MGTEALLANAQMPCRAHKEPMMQTHSLSKRQFHKMKKQEGVNWMNFFLPVLTAWIRG